MKGTLLAILFALTTTLSFAQGNYQDVVYLKNGSIIRGVIIEQVPNKSIKIETADRNVFVFQMDEIEKLTKEPYQGRARNDRNNTGPRSGYSGIVETGYQQGVGYYGSSRLKLNIINGYRFNPYLSMGLGVGMRYFTDPGDVLLPLFADFRVRFMDKTVTPYFSTGIGYSFDLGDGFTGAGFFLNPALGVAFKVSPKVALHVALDHEMQQVTTWDYSPYYNHLYNTYYYNANTRKSNSGAIGLTTGISF
ncbi:MAG: hypothetical protein KF797_08920 [Flavobacteriales bacterium]|nr:hypothetical protein [Flavobacteriales bacterium]